MSAVRMAPPAPPAITCETMLPTLRLPDCAAATTDGSNNVTICPSTPPPTKPEIMLPTVPRSKFGDALPAPTPPSAPATKLIRICSMSISYEPVTNRIDLAQTSAAHIADPCGYMPFAQQIGANRGQRCAVVHYSAMMLPMSALDQKRKLFDYLIGARQQAGGMTSPAAFAAVRLITNMNFDDCTTGRSPGLARLRR